MSEYDGSVRIKTEIDTKNANVQMMSLQNQIVKTADRINSLRSKMDSLSRTKIPTQEYAYLQKEIDKSREKLGELTERKERFLSTGGSRKSSAFARMEYDIKNIKENLRAAEIEKNRLVESGKAFTSGSDSEEYKKLSEQLKYAKNNMNALTEKQGAMLLKQKSINRESAKLSPEYKKIKKAMTGLLSIIARIGSGIKRAFSSLSKSSSSIGGIGKSLKQLLKYSLGVSSLLVLVNKFRNAAKEGFENLYNGVKPFKKSVNSLRADLLTLKNAFAAAFAPIVTAVIPYVQQLVQWLTEGMNKVAQFTAAITGQKTYMKAVKQTTSAIEEQGKKAEKSKKKQLSGLDQLNNLTSDKDNDKDKDKNPAAGMFEQAEVPNAFKNLADMIKEMWEKADFTELGAMLGTKLKTALDSIPWEDIKKTAEKVGKSFATLINGFVKVPGLGTTVGKTIAEGINTGLTGLNSFAKNLKWGAVGTFISDGINGIADYLDFKLLGQTIVNTLNGIVDMLYNFITKTKWGKIGEGIGASLSEVFINFKWEKFGATLGESVNALIEFIKSILDSTEWSALGFGITSGISSFIGSIKWENVGGTISSFAKSLFDFLIGLINGINWKELPQKIIDGVVAFFTGFDFAGTFGKWGELVGTVFAAGIDLIGGLADVLSQGWDSVVDYFSKYIEDSGGNIILGLWNGIKNAVKNVGKWIKDNIFKPFIDGFKKAFGIASPSKVMKEMGGYIMQGLIDGIQALVDFVSSIWEGMKEAASTIWSSAKNVIKRAIDGIKTVISTVLDTIKSVWSSSWNAIKKVASTAWNGIKNVFSGVSTWFKDKFEKAAGFVSGAFSKTGEVFTGIWKTIKDTFGKIGSWFKTKFETASENIKDAFTGVKTFFKDVWESIKDTFGNIAGWFKGKFTDAWTAVKNVFSTGGKIFSGIKDGILNGLKAVINTLIRGINNIISVPFDGLNAALKKIKSFDILGKKPFDWISEIKTPKIPELAKGAVIKGGNPFLALLGDQPAGQTNIEAPLPTITKAIFNALDKFNPPGYATGQVIPRSMKQHLALLGDNQTETEVVSPVSTIEEAVRNEICKFFGNGTVRIEIPITVGKREIGKAAAEYSMEEFLRTGKNVYVH